MMPVSDSTALGINTTARVDFDMVEILADRLISTASKRLFAHFVGLLGLVVRKRRLVPR